jgi:paraquat-inducible protein A
LVAIIKLGGMLDVHAGVGLWALAMLTVLLIALGGRQVRHLWSDFAGRLP